MVQICFNRIAATGSYVLLKLEDSLKTLEKQTENELTIEMIKELREFIEKKLKAVRKLKYLEKKIGSLNKEGVAEPNKKPVKDYARKSPILKSKYESGGSSRTSSTNVTPKSFLALSNNQSPKLSELAGYQYPKNQLHIAEHLEGNKNRNASIIGIKISKTPAVDEYYRADESNASSKSQSPINGSSSLFHQSEKSFLGTPTLNNGTRTISSFGRNMEAVGNKDSDSSVTGMSGKYLSSEVGNSGKNSEKDITGFVRQEGESSFVKENSHSNISFIIDIKAENMRQTEQSKSRDEINQHREQSAGTGSRSKHKCEDLNFETACTRAIMNTSNSSNVQHNIKFTNIDNDSCVSSEEIKDKLSIRSLCTSGYGYKNLAEQDPVIPRRLSIFEGFSGTPLQKGLKQYKKSTMKYIENDINDKVKKELRNFHDNEMKKIEKRLSSRRLSKASFTTLKFSCTKLLSTLSSGKLPVTKTSDMSSLIPPLSTPVRCLSRAMKYSPSFRRSIQENSIEDRSFDKLIDYDSFTQYIKHNTLDKVYRKRTSSLQLSMIIPEEEVKIKQEQPNPGKRVSEYEFEDYTFPTNENIFTESKFMEKEELIEMEENDDEDEDESEVHEIRRAQSLVFTKSELESLSLDCHLKNETTWVNQNKKYIPN